MESCFLPYKPVSRVVQIIGAPVGDLHFDQESFASTKNPCEGTQRNTLHHPGQQMDHILDLHGGSMKRVTSDLKVCGSQECIWKNCERIKLAVVDASSQLSGSGF